MQYLCKVGTPAGEVVERTFDATDEGTLRSELEQQGYYVFSLRRGLGARELGFGRRRVHPQTLLLFGQELAALLKAGLPLFQSLDVMLERQKDAVFHRSLTTVRDKVKSGTALSEAFRAEAELYPAIFAASLVAGERSGSLEGVLRRFVQYLRLNQALKKRAMAAAVYPMVLFGLMMVLGAILLIWVIPQFQGFYEGLGGAELPLATRVLMGAAAFVRGNLLWILVGLASGIVGGGMWLRKQGSGVIVDRLLLRMPFFGHLMRMYATSQLARTLSTLLAGGLPLLNALEVASASTSNRAMAQAVGQAAPLVREGKSLTVALESTGMIENLTLEMVKVGEQTGALAEMLNAVAEFYDEELETRIATVLALVEPVMLVFMAVIVAGMLLALYLPLFQVFSVLQRGGV